MSLETKIDIVVKNLNQLNKLADNLKNINKTNEKLVEGLNRIEEKLGRINSSSGNAFKKVTKDAREASKEVNNLGSRIADIVSSNKGAIGNFGIGSLLGIGATSGITKILDTFKSGVPILNSFTSKIPVLGEKLQIVQQQATGFDAVFDGILHNVANHPSLWGAAAVALTVFGGKFPVVVRGVKQLAVTLNGVGQAVTNNIVGKLVPATKHLVDMRVALVDVREQMENMTRGASLEELNIMVGMARKEMESFWHMTKSAEDAAIKLAVAMAAQRKEQTAINDLLFKAQGKATTAEQADNKRALNAQKQQATHSFDMFSTEAKQLEIVQRKNKLFTDSAKHYQRLVEKGGKMLDIEQRIERVMNRRKKGFGGAGGVTGKGGENLMLGAGFPLLFGGGVGSVAGGVGGALLGNMTGAGGFGMQILGSALGTMMDTAIQKAAKLGEALGTLSMDELVSSGIRLSSELQTQVDLLTRAGEIDKARAVLAAQVERQTGAVGGTMQDINNVTNILKAAWNDVTGSVGAALGIISTPFIIALAGVLKVVAMIAAKFNEMAGVARKILVFFGGLVPGLNESVAAVMDGLNPALQESIAKAAELGRQFRNNAALLNKELELRAAMPMGNTFGDQKQRASIKGQIKLGKFDAETEKLRGEGFKANPNFDEGSFMKERIAKRALIIQEMAQGIAKIDIQEEKLIAKSERQLQLKTALFGLDQKIAQAKTDEDKELEFRLQAEKQKATIISKAMEDAVNAQTEEAKINKLKETEVALNKVNLDLQTKIDEFRQKKKDEAEDVLTKLQNENNLLQGKLDGNEEEIKQQQLIEKIVDKIGIQYAHQVVKLVEKNGQLKEEVENTKKLDEQWKKIKETIATGMTDAIMGLIDGTKSLGESLAGVAKQLASMMIQRGIMGALKLNAEGGYERGGFQAFASGGVATRPMMGLVGEAGEDEYIIPASKMAQSMQRYSAGARGESVIPGTGQSSAGGGANAQTTVNYSGPILNFNSEEFVPKSAIGQIINSAASRGAKAGEMKTLATLQNSRSRRSTIGL